MDPKHLHDPTVLSVNSEKLPHGITLSLSHSRNAINREKDEWVGYDAYNKHFQPTEFFDDIRIIYRFRKKPMHEIVAYYQPVNTSNAIQLIPFCGISKNDEREYRLMQGDYHLHSSDCDTFIRMVIMTLIALGFQRIDTVRKDGNFEEISLSKYNIEEKDIDDWTKWMNNARRK